MTLSLKRRLLSKPIRGSRVQIYDIGTIRARNKNKAHSYLLELFKESDLTKAEVAKMLGKKPEQITRWLAGPGNLTLDTLSDLIFVMKGHTFTIQAKDDFARGKSNRRSPEWLQIVKPSDWKEVLLKASENEANSDNIQYTEFSSNKGTRYEQFRAKSEKELCKVS